MKDAKPLFYMSYKHGDFVRMTINLSRTERHTFFDLVVANFFGGPLPRSAKKLADICGMSRAEFERQWPSIKKFFTKRHGGFDCPYAVQLREEALQERAGKSKGGHMTAQKMREKRQQELALESAGDVALRVVNGLKGSKY